MAESVKLCECGCGNPAPLSPQKRRGFAQGQPQRFIRGHARRGDFGPTAIDKLMTRGERRDLGHATPCLVQPSGLLRTGYGQVRDGDRTRRSHIVVWEAINGPVPDGLELDHLCHDPLTCPGGWSCPHRACFEITHLALATHGDNVRRGGRHAAASNKEKP